MPAGLGGDPTSPPDRIERPADLRVARPDAVELRAGATDQLSRLAPLDGEQAEAVLGPVPVPPVEGLVTLCAALHAGEMARVLGVGIPACDGVAIVRTKTPQCESRRLDHTVSTVVVSVEVGTKPSCVLM